MKTWVNLLLALVVLAGAFAAWRLFRPASAAAGPSYRTAVVSRGDIVQTVSATGTISAVSTVEVGSQVSGNIFKLHADYNDPVKAGQLVAEIDPATYQARVVQAEGDVAGAEALLDLKRVAFTRAEQLLARELVSKSEYDQARAELRQQEAAVKIKTASLESAKLDLANTRIYSPIDGVVISRSVDVGQTVQASFSAPQLFNISQDLREMQIAANVSEADIGNVEAGQPVTFTVDAFPGRNFEGRVRQVRNNPVTLQNVVTYSTLITVANADMRLRPGMTATVVITTAHRVGVLRVADAALRFQPPMDALVLPEKSDAANALAAPDATPSAVLRRTAYVVEGARPVPEQISAGPLRPVAVALGIGDGAYTEVLSGLPEGALVAIGRSTAKAGAKTSSGILPKPPAGGPPAL